MKKFVRYSVFVLIAVVFVGTFVFLYKKSRPAEITYHESEAKISNIVRSTVLTGKIVPRDEVNIKPQISGIISVLYKEAGDYVQANEVIAKVKVIPDMGSLSAAESRVKMAQLNLDQAEVDYGREKALFEKNLVSAEEFDKVAQAYRQAQEERSAAQDALEVVRDGVSSSNASGSSTLVRSTVSGLILDVPVKVGNSVINSNTFNDGTTIATVANMDALIFNGNVDETEVGMLRAGMPVKITIGAIQDLSFEASLEYISPKAKENNNTNQFEVKAAVSVPKGTTIRSGYSANAEIVLQSVDSVVVVPESVIAFENDSTFVYVKPSSAAKVTGSASEVSGKEGRKKNAAQEYVRRYVETGMGDGINIEIKSGLEPGEVVRGTQIIK